MNELQEYLNEQEGTEKETFAVKNEYKIIGDSTIIYLRRRTGELIETLVDTKDLKKLSKIKNRWYANWDENTQSFYVQAFVKKRNNRWVGIQLHRYLMDCPVGLQVDHINHDTTDNRRSNLRIVTIEENLQNINGKYRNNTSGIRGVDNKGGRWRARIQVNKKPIHLGYFDNKKLAERAAIEARRKYFPHSKEAMLNE